MADYYQRQRYNGRAAGNNGRRQSTKQSRSRRKETLLREKRRVRKDVAVTAILLCAVFAFMVFYMVTYSATQEQTLFENDYNGREEALLSKNLRGKIYADDGSTVLAQSVDDGNGGETREYPYGSLFSHIVGYDKEGGAGIELAENYQLVHSDITLAEKAACDSAGEKYPGNEVYTTLNVDLQQAASDALGDQKGAVIVTDVKTGKILCMVSKPDFDPGTIEENWDSLLADSKTGTLVNRVTQGLYAPGSTFKIFDAIAFMQEDMQNAENFTFDCPGYVTIDGETITCFQWEVHGHLDFIGAFAHSCNSAFATIGYNLDRSSFNLTLKNLLFDQDLPYDMPSSQSSYVLDSDTSTKEVMQLSIGQGQTVMSPLHLNMITAAIANGGTIYKPYSIASVRTAQTSTNPQGRVLDETPEATAAVENAISSDICAKMRELMRGVVEFGTATKLVDRSYNACGKTGSAEFLSGSNESHAWFTGFAPYDNPEVAITVIVEGAGTGGSAAVPVAKDVLDQYFHYDGSSAMQQATYFTSTTSYKTTESDEDKTPDNVMALNMDTNGDGVMDAIDVDGDGVPDAFDLDGDGIADTMAVDGQPVTGSTQSEASDTGDSTEDQTDANGNGIPDAEEDLNGNGIPDGQETQEDGTNTTDTGNADADANQQQQDQTIEQIEQNTETANANGGQNEETSGQNTGTDTVNGQTGEDQNAQAGQESAAGTTPVDTNGDGFDDNTGLQIVPTQ